MDRFNKPMETKFPQRPHSQRKSLHFTFVVSFRLKTHFFFLKTFYFYFDTPISEKNLDIVKKRKREGSNSRRKNPRACKVS